MDNASYHNVLSPVSSPTPSCKKEKIRSWLERNHFPVKDDCLKAELVEILTKVGPQPIYVLDEIASEQGHEVLRTPPYHPELQPIETCWGIVKNEIARNCDFYDPVTYFPSIENTRRLGVKPIKTVLP